MIWSASSNSLVLRELADVAGVDDEVGLARHRGDPGDRLAVGGARVGVDRRLGEADMAVADLHEAERPGRPRGRGRLQADRGGHAAGQRPDQAGPGPRHAFQEAAAAFAGLAIFVVVRCAHRSSPHQSEGKTRGRRGLFPRLDIGGPLGLGAAAMASIIIADRTGRYDGRDLETRPMGATETTIIRLSRELARRGHDVTVHTNGEEDLVHHGRALAPAQRTAAGCLRRLRRRAAGGAAGLRAAPEASGDLGALGRQPAAPLQEARPHVALPPDPDPDEPGAGERLLAGAAAPRRHQRDPPAAAARRAGPGAAGDAAAAPRDLRLQPAAQPARAGRALGRADPAAGARRGARRLRRPPAHRGPGRLDRVGRHAAADRHERGGEGLGDRASQRARGRSCWRRCAAPARCSTSATSARRSACRWPRRRRWARRR